MPPVIDEPKKCAVVLAKKMNESSMAERQPISVRIKGTNKESGKHEAKHQRGKPRHYTYTVNFHTAF